MSPKISVIIPFYQKEKGILRRAVNSVLAQTYTEYEILITDDGSPTPAEEEMRDLIIAYPGKIRLFKQKNAGPGAARNKCLDNISADTKYVAFLDSDDEWSSSHLKNAIIALNQGYDFYCSDPQRPNTPHTHFDFITALDRFGCKKIDDHLYEVTSDLFDGLLRQNIIGTTTAVYCYKKFPNLRFREELYFGEDLVFWLNFSQLSNKIVISTNIEVRRGKGINIYSGSGWGSDTTINLIQNMIKCYKYITKYFILSSEQGKVLKNRIMELRYSFACVFLHEIRRKKKLHFPVVFKQAKIDPLTLFIFPLSCLKIFLKKIIIFNDFKKRGLKSNVK